MKKCRNYCLQLLEIPVMSWFAALLELGAPLVNQPIYDYLKKIMINKEIEFNR